MDIPAYAVDAWSWVHVAVFGVAAYVLSRVSRASLAPVLAAVFVAGVAWEIVEHQLVAALALYDEPWYNRWVTDILADGLGGALGWRLAAWVRRRNTTSKIPRN